MPEGHVDTTCLFDLCHARVLGVLGISDLEQRLRCSPWRGSGRCCCSADAADWGCRGRRRSVENGLEDVVVAHAVLRALLFGQSQSDDSLDLGVDAG